MSLKILCCIWQSWHSFSSGNSGPESKQKFEEKKNAHTKINFAVFLSLIAVVGVPFAGIQVISVELVFLFFDVYDFVASASLRIVSLSAILFFYFDGIRHLYIYVFLFVSFLRRVWFGWSRLTRTTVEYLLRVCAHRAIIVSASGMPRVWVCACAERVMVSLFRPLSTAGINCRLFFVFLAGSDLHLVALVRCLLSRTRA